MMGPAASRINISSEYERGFGTKKGLTIIPRSLKHPNALLDRRSRISFIIRGIDRWQQSDIDPKVLICQFASLLDRFAEGIWTWLGQGGEDSETARV